MNNEIKIALTIVLEPKKLLSSRILKHIDGEQPNIVKEETYSKGVFQNTYLSIDTYNDMVKTKPFFVKEKDWKRFTKTQRIDVQMKRICEHLNGHSYSFEILV